MRSEYEVMMVNNLTISNGEKLKKIQVMDFNKVVDVISQCVDGEADTTRTAEIHRRSRDCSRPLGCPRCRCSRCECVSVINQSGTRTDFKHS